MTLGATHFRGFTFFFNALGTPQQYFYSIAAARHRAPAASSFGCVTHALYGWVWPEERAHCLCH